jgi:integrase
MMNAAGTGNIEQIGKSWYLRTRVTVKDPIALRTTRKLTRIRLGSTREIRSAVAARAIADRYLALLIAPTLKPGVNTTFREYSERFQQDHVALMREASRRAYNGHIAQLQRALGPERLSAIDTPCLQTAITALSFNRAPATVKKIRAIALQIIRRARADGFAAHAIDTASIKLPRASRVAPERRSFTREQLEQIIAADGQPWASLWGVMGYGALRIGEALALTWSDIDLAARTLRVRGNVTRGGVAAPKTAKSAATIPMLPRLEQILAAYRAQWRPNAADLLFASRNGTPLNADHVRDRKLAPLLARLGIAPAGLHAFRHSVPAILAEIGLNIEAVRQFMRHTDIRMTARYMHVSTEQVREAIDSAFKRQQSAQKSSALPGL